MSKIADRINKPVISYCEIPEGLIEEDHWLNTYPCDCYVPYTVPKLPTVEAVKLSRLDEWIIFNYPELESEDILIHVDY
jgi:hypothetical protein